MFRAINTTFTLYERSIVYTMGLLVLLAAFAYVTFLVRAVVAAGQSDVAERRIDAVRGELAEAEKKYVDLSRSITIVLAVERGFSDASAVRYASQSIEPSSLSIRSR